MAWTPEEAQRLLEWSEGLARAYAKDDQAAIRKFTELITGLTEAKLHPPPPPKPPAPPPPPPDPKKPGPRRPAAGGAEALKANYSGLHEPLPSNPVGNFDLDLKQQNPMNPGKRISGRVPKSVGQLALCLVLPFLLSKRARAADGKELTVPQKSWNFFAEGLSFLYEYADPFTYLGMLDKWAVEKLTPTTEAGWKEEYLKYVFAQKQRLIKLGPCPATAILKFDKWVERDYPGASRTMAPIQW